MTKEELRKEATFTKEWELTPMIDRPTFINGYITGVNSREAQIGELTDKLKESKNQIKILTDSLMEVCEVNKQLEQQIGKMKGCQNCKNTWNGYRMNICESCSNSSKWELKENDS